MDEAQIRQHILILGWLNLAASGFLILLGLFLFLLLGGISFFIHDPHAEPVLWVVGVGVGLLLLILSLPGLFAGYGLLKYRPWGRVLATITGALHLFNIPVGTALAVYTFVVLASPQAEAVFRGKGAA